MDTFNLKSILVILFLFFIGCLMGWCIEVVFRKFFSTANPTHKWINPGFLVGPYLPLYGFGLVVLYLLSLIRIDVIDSNPLIHDILIVLFMGIAMTVVEYIAGRIFIVGMNVKLWDYSDEWGNIQGIICPRFSFYWCLISALYYFLLHKHVLNAVYWLADHLTFSFFIGFFYGVFVIDCVVSFNILAKIKKLAEEKNIVVRLEELKSRIAVDGENRTKKPSFLLILHEAALIKNAFENNPESFSIKKKLKEKAEQITENIREKSEAVSENIRQRSEAISENIKQRSEAISDNIRQHSEVIGSNIKIAGSEVRARVSDTLSRNDSSDIADDDLFDNSHKAVTNHSCSHEATSTNCTEKSSDATYSPDAVSSPDAAK